MISGGNITILPGSLGVGMGYPLIIFC